LAHRRECSNAITTTRRYPTDPWQGHDFTPLSCYRARLTLIPLFRYQGRREFVS